MRLNPFRLVGAVKGIIELSKSKRLANMSGWRTFLFVVQVVLVVFAFGAAFQYFAGENSTLTITEVVLLLLSIPVFLFAFAWIVAGTSLGRFLSASKENDELIERLLEADRANLEAEREKQRAEEEGDERNMQ